MGKLTPEMIKAIQTEYEKCHSYAKTAKTLDIDERTVKKHASGLNSNFSITNRRGISKAISNSGADDRKMNKAIYKELRRGRKPDEIIEKHGFPSMYVQAEYELFNRNRNTDMIDFQKSYIDGIEAYVISFRADLQRYISTFNEKGYLTNNELLELQQEIEITV